MTGQIVKREGAAAAYIGTGGTFRRVWPFPKFARSCILSVDAKILWPYFDFDKIEIENPVFARVSAVIKRSSARI